MSVNKVILIGNLTKEPMQNNLPDGSFVTNITVACNEKYKDKSGEQKELVEFINISFFGKLAEIAKKYLLKGNPVYVEGKLNTSKYTDKNGVEKYSTKVIATSMQLLGSKSETQPKDASSNKSKDGFPDKLSDIDDLGEIPF